MSDWFADGVTPHPTGGYVHVERTPAGIRYLDAQRRMHRRGGPAIEGADGTREWYVGGQSHHLDGPAVERSSGSREWYVDDKLHRLDGPAIERADGSREWWVGGQPHRLDGPAVEYADGSREWWLRDVQVTEAEHAEIVAQLREIGEAPDV